MIREAKESDCINLAALSMEVWLTTYSMEGIRRENSDYLLSVFTETHFKGLLANERYKLWVWVEGIYLRGYVLIDFDSRFGNGDHGFEIQRLYVHSPFQHQGIGQNLFDHVKNRHGDRFWLYTWVKNKSIGFYKKQGLVEVGRYEFLLGDEVIENLVLAHGQ